jgi:hypothetical protein
MGEFDFYAEGDWNFFCDLCGKKSKAKRAAKTWDNFYVCEHHKEVRNPQDFVRGIKDNQRVPFVRSDTAPTFVPYVCTLQGTNAIPLAAIPGCVIPGYVNTAFLPYRAP